MGKQNLAMFERAMRMMSPYGGMTGSAKPAEPAAEPEKEDPNLKRLEAQIEALRHQLEALGKKG
jgi:polyhydroxyalkanoate synthesis regulator protein